MERLEYKGRVIEIFTTKIKGQWTWAFTVNGIRAAINRDPECCESSDLAKVTSLQIWSDKMDDKSALRMLAELVSVEAGRNNALTAAVVGILDALKTSPELAGAVHASFEHHYSEHLATSQLQEYMNGFETTRNLLYAALFSAGVNLKS